MSEQAFNRIRYSLGVHGDASGVTEHDITDLDQELDGIITQIASSGSFEQASDSFDTLIRLHDLLAILLFKYGLALTARQENVTRILDRWDDEETRRYFYQEIVEGRI